MGEGVRSAALAGATALAHYGRLPLDIEDAIQWAWRELGVDVRWCDDLPGQAYACCYSTPHTGIRGRVLLSPRAPHHRFSLAHEIGHLLLGNGASFSLAHEHWQMLPAEKEANAFAATWLVDDDDLCCRLEEGLTLHEMADLLAIPHDAVLLRMQLSRMLGEVNVRRLEASLMRLCDGDH